MSYYFYLFVVFVRPISIHAVYYHLWNEYFTSHRASREVIVYAQVTVWVYYDDTH